jgi:hypothetical protein
MDVESIRIISAIFSIIGSLLLAYRVTGILRALATVGNAHEGNIQNLANQNKNRVLVQLVNSTERVREAQKLPLLVVGFAFIILAAVLQLVALLCQTGVFGA